MGVLDKDPCLYLAGYLGMIYQGLSPDDLVSIYSMFEGNVGILDSFYSLGSKEKFVKLVSYLRDKLGQKFRILLDSGAYTWYEKQVGKFKDGIYVDYSWVEGEKFRKYFLSYVEWLKQEGRYVVDEYVNLDVIRNPELSYQNFVKMREQGLEPIPVIHEGTDLSYIDKYLAGWDKDRFGIGIDDFSGKTILWWLKPVFSYISDNYPNLRVHGFGCFLKDIMTKFDFWSVDSATWRRIGANYGVLYWFNGSSLVPLDLNEKPYLSSGSGRASSAFWVLTFERDQQLWFKFLHTLRKVFLALGEDVYVSRIDSGTLGPKDAMSLLSGKVRRSTVRRIVFNAFSFVDCWRFFISKRKKEVGYVGSESSSTE